MRITKILIGLAAIVVASGIIISSCNRSKPKGDVGSGPADGVAINVLALDDSFRPRQIEAPAGKEVTVEIENAGESGHEFKLEDLGINTGTIGPGKTAHATFVVASGTTEFVCSYHGGMKGRIVGA